MTGREEPEIEELAQVAEESYQAIRETAKNREENEKF